MAKCVHLVLLNCPFNVILYPGEHAEDETAPAAGSQRVADPSMPLLDDDVEQAPSTSAAANSDATHSA